MTVLKYKDYVGSMEFDLEENCLCGKLLHIRDLVTYEANDPAGLKAAFEEAVDDYLQDCAITGEDPDKPFKGVFNVRIRPELHRELAIAAKSLGCTLNEYVSETLSAHKRGPATSRPNDQVIQQWMDLAIRGAHSSTKHSNLPSSHPWNVKAWTGKGTSYAQQSAGTEFNKVVPIRAAKELH